MMVVRERWSTDDPLTPVACMHAGEKQIEMDKRELRDRAGQLRRELEAVRTHRRNYRERRNNMPIPVAALVSRRLCKLYFIPLPQTRRISIGKPTTNQHKVFVIIIADDSSP